MVFYRIYGATLFLWFMHHILFYGDGAGGMLRICSNGKSLNKI